MCGEAAKPNRIARAAAVSSDAIDHGVFGINGRLIPRNFCFSFYLINYMSLAVSFLRAGG
jgi:hypothetical protein